VFLLGTVVHRALRNGYFFVNTVAMRRALVLTDESARHPFRAILPMSSRRVGEIENRRSWRLNFFDLDAGDLRHFASTYCACFLATTAFIA
jgi:hypothetical protein